MEYYEQEKSRKEKFEDFAEKHKNTVIGAAIGTTGLILGFTFGKRKGAKLKTKEFAGLAEFAYQTGISDGKTIALENIVTNAITENKNN